MQLMITLLTLLLYSLLLLPIILIIRLFLSNFLERRRLNSVSAQDHTPAKTVGDILREKSKGATSVVLQKTQDEAVRRTLLEQEISALNPGVSRLALTKQFLTLILPLSLTLLLTSCRAGGIGNSSSTASSSNEVDNSQGDPKCKQHCETDHDGQGNQLLVVTEVCNGEVSQGPDFFTPDKAPPVCLPLIESLTTDTTTPPAG